MPDFHTMFHDFEAYQNTLEAPDRARFDSAVQRSPDKEQFKRLAANQAWAADTFGIDPQRVSAEWGVLRPQIAKSIFSLDGEVGEDQFHGAVAGRLETDRQRQVFRADTATRALEDALLNEGDDWVPGYQGHLDTSRESAAEGFEPGAEGQYLEIYKQVFAGVKDRVGSILPDIKVAAEGGEIEMDVRGLGDLISGIADLPDDERMLALYAIQKRVEETGQDPRTYLGKLGESVRRGGIDLLERSKIREDEREATLVERALESGEQVYVDTQIRPDSPARFTTSAGFFARKNTPVSGKGVLEEIQAFKKELGVRRQLRQWIDGELDPLEHAGKFAQGLIDFSRFAPQVGASIGTTALNPYAGFAMTVGLATDARYDAAMAANPDADPLQVERLAASQGIVDGGLEMVGNLFVLGRLGAVSRAVQKTRAIVRVPATAAGSVGIELGEELLQDTSAIAIREIANALSTDIPALQGEKWEDVWNGENVSRTFFAVLPFAVLGVGGNEAARFMQPSVVQQTVTDTVSLQQAGFTPAQIEEIGAAETISEKVDLYQKHFDPKAANAVAAQEIERATKTFNARQADPAQPTVQRRGDGYFVTRPDGQRVGASDQYQAEQLALDFGGEPISPDPAGTPLGIAAGLDAGQQRKINRLKRNASRVFLENGEFPKEFRKPLRDLEDQKAATVQTGREMAGDLQKAAKDAKVEPEVIQRAIEGDDAAMDFLPHEVRQHAASARRFLDDLSREAITRGIVSDEMADTFRSNLGKWLRRSYKVFDESFDWNEATIPQEIVANAKEYLIREQDLTPDQADAAIQRMTNRDDGQAILSGGKNYAAGKDITSLIRRKELAPEIVALLGEIRDPFFNIEKSAGVLGQFIASHEAQQKLIKIGLESGLFSKTEDGRHPHRVVSGDGGRFDVLAGEKLFAQKEVAELFARPVATSMISGAAQAVGTAFKTLSGISKATKVVFSPDSWPTQYIGALIMEAANGRISLAGKTINGEKFNVLSPLGVAFTDTRIGGWAISKNKAKNRDLRNEMLKRGVLDQSIIGKDFSETMRGGMAEAMRQAGLARGSQAVQKVSDTMAEIFMGGDNAGKVNAFIFESAVIRKAHPSWTDDAVFDLAAEVVKATTPTYSQIPKGLRELSQLGLPLQSFFSFSYEVFRNTTNSYRMGVKELRSENATMRKRGALRLASMSAVMTASSASVIGGLSKILSGVSDEEDEGFRKYYGFPWDTDSILLYTNFEDGEISFTASNYLLPQSILLSAVQSFREGESIAESVEGMFATLVNEFFAEGVLVTPILDVLRNKTSSGRPVYNEELPPSEQVELSAKHIFDKGLNPGVIKKIERIYKAATGETGDFGRSFSLKEEGARLLGIRSFTIDVTERAPRIMSKFAARLNQATSIKKDSGKRHGEALPEDVERSEASVEEIKAEFAEFVEVTRDLMVGREIKGNRLDNEDVDFYLMAHMTDRSVPLVLRETVFPNKKTRHYQRAKREAEKLDIFEDRKNASKPQPKK